MIPVDLEPLCRRYPRAQFYLTGDFEIEKETQYPCYELWVLVRLGVDEFGPIYYIPMYQIVAFIFDGEPKGLYDDWKSPDDYLGDPSGYHRGLRGTRGRDLRAACIHCGRMPYDSHGGG